MQKWLLLNLCLVLLLPTLSAQATQHDTIVLKTKKVIEGNIIYTDPEWIKIRQGANKILLIAQEDIFAIQRHEQTEGYIRYSKIRQGRSALEVASKTFANRDRTKMVSLVGAVHIGDVDYYHRLQSILDGHDVVLFEGVGAISNEDLTQWTPPTAAEKEAELSGRKHIKPNYQRTESASNLDILTTFQTYIGQFLDLSFQKDGLNYLHSWWKPADVSMEELQGLMQQKGVNFFDFLTMAQSNDMEQQANQLYSSLLNNFSAILLGKPISIAAKETFAELLSTQMAMMDPTQGNSDTKNKSNKLMEILILCRNDKAYQCTKDVLTVPQVKTVAVFYGAGHNADLERRLIEDGFELYKEEWLIAWDIKDPSVPATQDADDE